MAGLGAYPEFTEPNSGHGPTKEFSKLKEVYVPIQVPLIVLGCCDERCVITFTYYFRFNVCSCT